MTINQSFGFNLSILSFDLPINLVKETDDIIVSITTLPEHYKKAVVVPAKKMKNPYINFGFNVKIPSEYIPKDFVSACTEKVLLVFRKKSFFHNNPIVAFTAISVKDFPKNVNEPIQSKKINLYKEIQKVDTDSKNNNNSMSFNKKIVGYVNVKMALNDPFQLGKFEDDQMLDIKDNESFKFRSGRFGFTKL